MCMKLSLENLNPNPGLSHSTNSYICEITTTGCAAVLFKITNFLKKFNTFLWVR